MITYIKQILERNGEQRLYPLMRRKLDPVAQVLFCEIPERSDELCDALIKGLAATEATKHEWLCGYYVVGLDRTLVVSEIPGYDGSCTVSTEDFLNAAMNWKRDLNKLAV